MSEESHIFEMNQYKNGIKFRELLIPCFNSRRTHIYLNINSVSEGLYISYHRHFGQQLDIHIRYMSTLHSPHLSYLACWRYIAPKRFVFDEVHQEKSIRHSPPCGATHIKEHMIEVIVVMLCYVMIILYFGSTILILKLKKHAIKTENIAFIHLTASEGSLLFAAELLADAILSISSMSTHKKH